MGNRLPLLVPCSVKLRPRALAAGLALASTAIAPRLAAAEPLVIQSGYFGFSGGDPASFRFIGQGFTFGSILFTGFPDFGPLRTCPYGTGCDPGTPVDLGASYAGPLVNWQTFEAPADIPRPDPNAVLYSIALLVTGPVIEVPTATTSFTHVTGPFNLTATLTANAITGSYSDYVLGAVLFSTTLSGRGTVDLGLDSWQCVQFNCSVGPPYRPAYLDYRFSDAADPIPEPSTLLLVGSGGIAMLRIVRRWRRPTAG